MTKISSRNTAGCMRTIRRGLLAPLSRSFSNTAEIMDAHGRQVESSPTTFSFKDMAHGNPLGLPRLPIPALGDTMSRYLKSVEPLARDRPEDIARAQALVRKFLEEDGATLHSSVVKDDASRSAGYPHSYVEELWDDMYLEGRWSLPINSNPYIALQPAPPEHAAAALAAGSDLQIEGATLFISSLLKWNKRVLDGTFEPDPVPLRGCLRGCALQCGTARIPLRGRDEVKFYPTSRHAVVFCNNRVFRLDLLEGEGGERQISKGELRKALEGIRASAFSRPCSSESPFIGHLTTMNRDEWATSRAALKGLSEANEASLLEIDSALITIALDDLEIAGAQDEARTFLTGDKGRNRWFDKHQLVVLKNGAMAVNFEHSFSDGMVWVRMLGEIWHDMYGVPGKGVKPFPQPPLLLSSPTLPPPRELSWKLPDSLKDEAVSASRAFQQACEGYTLDYVEFREFGKNACKDWRVSPDAVAQMAFHLAFRRLHGVMPSTYESCSTRAFFRGRTEVIRSCTSESADFASTMESASKIKDTRRSALDLAATKHVKLAKTAAQGQGIDRHILALRSASKAAASSEGGVRILGEAFFEDRLLAESSEWRLSTSNLSLPFLKCFGFGAVTGNGYGLGYTIHEEMITVPITAFRGGETDGKLLADEVVRALGEISTVYR